MSLVHNSILLATISEPGLQSANPVLGELVLGTLLALLGTSLESVS